MRVIIKTIAIAAATFCAAPLACLAADGEGEVAQTKAPVATTLAQAEPRFVSTSSVRSDTSIAPEGFDFGKRGARLAARQGPDALRRYINRTRMIYALDIREFMGQQP